MSETRKLGERIWEAAEEAQGFAFISDDICSWSDEAAYQRALDALDWEREAIRRIRRAIASYQRAKRKRFDAVAAKVLAP